MEYIKLEKDWLEKAVKRSKPDLRDLLIEIAKQSNIILTEYKDNEQLELLKEKLIHAYWTIEFLHYCLTDPKVYIYCYPDETIKILESIKSIVEVPEPCYHSMFQEDCKVCQILRRQKPGIINEEFRPEEV